MAYVIERPEHLSPVDARRAGPTADDRRHGRQSGRADRLPFPRRRRERRGNRTAADTRRGRTVSLPHAAVTFAFRFNKGHFTSLPATSSTFGQCDNSAECLFILLVLSRMRFYC